MIPFTQHTVDVRGVELSVLVGGQDKAPTIVFLHGMRDVAWSLAPVASALGDTHRVILVELRGHGASDKPGAYTMEHYVYDILRITQQFCSEPATYVGHSLGGHIVARFVSLFPEHAQRAVLLEGLGPPRIPPTTDPIVYVQQFRQRLLQRFAEPPPSRGMATTEEAAQRLLRNNPRMTKENAAFLAEKSTVRGADGRLRWNFDHHAASALMNVSQADLEMYWQAIRCPTLVVSGKLAFEYWRTIRDDDAFDGHYAPGEMEGRAAMMPKGQHLYFEHSGHMVHFDEPDRLVDEIRAFITNNP